MLSLDRYRELFLAAFCCALLLLLSACGGGSDPVADAGPPPGQQQPGGNDPPPGGNPPPGDDNPPPGEEKPSPWAGALSVAAAAGTVDSPVATAVDGSGNGLAVWSASVSGALPRIFASRRQEGAGWSAPQPLSGDGVTATEPKMAMDPQGRAFVIWRQGNSIANQQVMVARYTADDGWSTPTLLSNIDGAISRTSVGVDAQGNAMVVWGQQQAQGSGYGNLGVRISRFDVFGGWTGPVNYFPAEADTPVSLASAVAGDGTALMVYAGSIDGKAVVRSARYSPGVGWQYPETLQTDTTGGVFDEVSVAVDDEGRAVASWKRNGPSQATALFAATRDDEWVWGDAQRLDDGVATARDARMAMTQDGKAVVVWVSGISSALERLAARQFNGTAWGEVSFIDADPRTAADMRLADSPSIAAAGNRYAVAWRQFSGAGYDVKARLLEPGGWGDAALLETSTSATRLPVVAGSGNGRVLAAWTQGGPVMDIWSSFLK